MGSIDAYLGFAVKSGKIIYGLDNIRSAKRKMRLLIMCPTAGANLVKGAEGCAQKQGIPLLITERPLEDIIFKTNCKLIALLDEHMAKAVLLTAGR